MKWTLYLIVYIHFSKLYPIGCQRKASCPSNWRPIHDRHKNKNNTREIFSLTPSFHRNLILFFLNTKRRRRRKVKQARLCVDRKEIPIIHKYIFKTMHFYIQKNYTRKISRELLKQIAIQSGWVVLHWTWLISPSAV